MVNGLQNAVYGLLDYGVEFIPRFSCILLILRQTLIPHYFTDDTTLLVSFLLCCLSCHDVDRGRVVPIPSLGSDLERISAWNSDNYLCFNASKISLLPHSNIFDSTSLHSADSFSLLIWSINCLFVSDFRHLPLVIHANLVFHFAPYAFLHSTTFMQSSSPPDTWMEESYMERTFASRFLPSSSASSFGVKQQGNFHWLLPFSKS